MRTIAISLAGAAALSILPAIAFAQSPGREIGFTGNLPEGLVAQPAAPGDVPGEALAYQTPVERVHSDGWRSWGHYVYGSARLGADPNGAGIRSTSNGLTVGIERSFGPTFAMGVSLGYARTRSESIGVKSDGDAYAATTYAWWNPVGGLEIDALVGIAGSESDVKRSVLIGTGPTLLNGSASAMGLTSLAAVGYRFRFDTAMGPAYLKPFASISYASQDRDAYSETNGAGSGLYFPGKTYERSLLNLGAAAGVDVALGDGWTLRPELSVAWSRHLVDPSPSVPVMDIATGASYRLRDPRQGRDGLLVSTEVSVWKAASLQVFAGYTGEFRDNYVAHQARVGLRMTW